jgi:hypothetical protein
MDVANGAKLLIHAIDGKRVKEILWPNPIIAGTRVNVTWDGIDDLGHPVANGGLLVTIQDMADRFIFGNGKIKLMVVR